MMASGGFALSLMPEMAADLGTSTPRIGYLVTVFARAMAVGGPALLLLLARLTPRSTVLILFATFPPRPAGQRP